MSLQIQNPSYGILPDGLATLDAISPSDCQPLDVEGARFTPTNPFEEIVRLVQSNDRLFTERDALLSKLDHARARLTDPNGNRNFATAYLSHLKLKHSSVVARLRANRLEARQILARLESGSNGEA